MKTIHSTYGYLVHHLGTDPITAPPRRTRQQINKAFFCCSAWKDDAFPYFGSTAADNVALDEGKINIKGVGNPAAHLLNLQFWLLYMALTPA